MAHVTLRALHTRCIRPERAAAGHTGVELPPRGHVADFKRRAAGSVLCRASTVDRSTDSSVAGSPSTSSPKPVPKMEPLPATSFPPCQVDGLPRFVSPWPQDPDLHAASAKPIMIYLPGIDGNCAGVELQIPTIVADFQLINLIIPRNDRTPFTGLIDLTCSFLADLAATVSPSRTVYLVGESFGGLLALAVARLCPDWVDRVVLVNPATGFKDTAWPQLVPVLGQMPDAMWPALPYVLMPILGNPVGLTAHRALAASNPVMAALVWREDLLALLPSLSLIAEYLPRETLLWKLEGLAAGCEHMEDKYHEVRQRVFVVSSEWDFMLPSADEAENLQKLLPICNSVVLPMRGHTLLREAGVDLVQIMKDNGFFAEERKMSGASAAQKLPRRANGFGRPHPVELPTPLEFKRDAEGFKDLQEAFSPVYFSATADGVVQQGLHNLPVQQGKPVLLLGNHQTVPLDTGFIVKEVFAATGVLPRGLTHPSPLTIRGEDRLRSKMLRKDGEEESPLEGQGTLGLFLQKWGAVPVGPNALFRLLRDGECVLLFPGGATEALKGTRTVDRYALYWSPRAEAVRVAARFSATIIPFGAIGCEEGASAVMNADNFSRIANRELAEASRAQARARPARKGVNVDDSFFGEELLSKLYVPRRLDRWYFLFGRPLQTSRVHYDDKDEALALYQECKRSVEDCITYLLERRESDPYRNFVKRALYERTYRRQAPTFVPQADDRV